jgi:REP element-mobilizing transposase RayT
MPQSLAKLITHLTFSTKQRRPAVTPEIRPGLCAYMSGILNKLESSAIEINCVADHAHLLFALSRKRSLAEVVEEVKKGSSKWVKTQSAALGDFHWQAGYGAFSVSQSNVPSVQKYILNQDQHHRKMTFQEEFLALLAKHGIEFDEQYVWD